MPHIDRSSPVCKEVGLGGGMLMALPFPHACIPVVNAEAGVITPALFTAGILAGLLIRDPSGAARTDITDTATNMAIAMGNPQVGQSFFFAVRNNADAAEAITLNAGTGVTFSGAGQSTTTIAIAQNNTKLFVLTVDTVTYTATGITGATMTLYSLGSFVH
jgi:hypothetical protein